MPKIVVGGKTKSFPYTAAGKSAAARAAGKPAVTGRAFAATKAAPNSAVASGKNAMKGKQKK